MGSSISTTKEFRYNIYCFNYTEEYATNYVETVVGEKAEFEIRYAKENP